MEVYKDIFDYITRQESNYKKAIPINDSWSWSMADHIKTSELYKHSQLLTGKNDFKPVKNIVRPILNLQYRTEDIEVKDVQLYVDDADKYHLSFLVKKYHDDVFTQEYDLDTFFDALNTSRIDFGGGLSKQLNHPCPEVVPLQSIAFCDQTDMLSGPIGIKHFYSPDQLLEMESRGWGKESNGATISVKELIKLSREEKKENKDSQTAQTPGRYIEVYEVHGNLPKNFADKSDDSGEFETRIFICAFYQKKGVGDKNGVILYTAPETTSPFKLTKRDPVHGRALGFGGVEELFDSQVWVNYDVMRMQDMLDAASKTILKTSDPNVANRNNLKDMDNLEIVEIAPNTDLSQVDTFPRNKQLFDNSVVMWENHAKDMGAAQDPIQGKEPSAGTPFSSLAEQVRQGMGLHEWRRGQFAKHLEEIYKDWIIPHIEKKICEGAKFLSELSLDELQYVTDAIIENEAQKMIKDKMLSGVMGEKEILAIQKEGVDAYKEQIRTQIQKKGNKFFLELLKGEFKGARLGVKVNVAGKQRNLASVTEKITNIFRFAFSSPQGFAMTMQIPGMAKAFNDILEYGGLSPVDFSGIEKLALPPPPTSPQPAGQQPAPASPGAPVATQPA